MSTNGMTTLMRLQARKRAAEDEMCLARQKLSEAQREFARKHRAHQKAVMEYLDYAERRV
ncbi:MULTISPECIES: hypothetical protein [Methylococcus]|uniref:Flagellar FliJ protein n=1 Tax=Methylococcus capsulatus TaxID=414 RepID=A0ABZ2F3B3_METCP|nr:hypothetical protein [Methylococcus sp. BF19-07]